tara:strand:- start:90 stop:449 length:360 start_codon:yes stop_codon:yes gene_type:complete
MRYLSKNQAFDLISQGRTLELEIGSSEENGFKTFQWLAIEKGREDKNRFYLIFHNVFDDRDQGIESVYNFSYVEPDEIYGKIIKEFTEVSDLKSYLQEHYSDSLDSFLLEGNMDSVFLR